MNYQVIVRLEQLRAIAEESPDAPLPEVTPEDLNSSLSFEQALSQTTCTPKLQK